MMIVYSKRIYVIFFLFMLFITPRVFSKPLHITKPFTYILPHHNLDFLIDEAGTLTIDDITSGIYDEQWFSVPTANPQFGNTSSVYWLRMSIHNDMTSDQEIFIVQDYSFIDYIDFYSPQGDTYSVIQTGIKRKFADRPFESTIFVFPVTIPANSQNTYYLRQHTVMMSFDISVYSPHEFIMINKRDTALHLLFIGILFAMCLYHLIIYFFIRHIVYLYYIMLTACLGFFLITISGIGFQYFWTDILILTDIMFILSNFSLNIFIILFTNRQLEIKKFFPVLYKIGIGLIFANCLMLFVILIAPRAIAAMLISVTVVCTNFYILLCSIIMSLKRYRTGYFFFLASVTYTTGYILFSLSINDLIILTDFIYWFFIYGMIAFAVLYAFTLADKMNKMRVNLAALNNRLEQKVAKRTGELRSVNEKLKEMDRIKSNFFANVSHEIRTPLTLILSPVESVLQGDFKRPVDESFFTNIRNNAVRLLRLINNILDFSKLEAKRMTLKIKQVNIVSLLSHYLNTISSAIESKAITLRFHSPFESLPLFIDGEKIGTVFMNVFSNALKFTDKNGSISISIDADDEYCSISVADTGIGIPQNKLTKIFDRFSRAETDEINKYEGTGIGLSLAREFMLLHGGTIVVKSKHIDEYPGEHGTVFTLTIPRGKDHFEGNTDIEFALGEQLSDDIFDASHREFSAFWKMYDLMEQNDDSEKGHSFDYDFPEEETGDNALRQKVLIVDDNKDMRNFIRFLLRDEYTVFTAVNGREGLDKTIALSPDLVITDVMMPIMNGYELTHRIKEHPQLKKIPILLLTAKIEISNKIEGLEHGADDYLTKPFNSKELLSRIKSMLRLKRMQDELRDMNANLSFRVKEATQDLAEREYETLEMLGNAAEYRDPETGSHIERVAQYSRLIAKELGLGEEDCELLYHASPLHDIGKIGIEDAVLQKPGRLTDEEFEKIKQHSMIGYEILKNKKSKYLQTAALICLTHHEKYDGSGYPNALSGEDIHIYGRIVALADVFDAITSNRCYNDRLSFDQAMELIISEKGKHFDPMIVDIFITNIEQVKEIYRQLKED